MESLELRRTAGRRETELYVQAAVWVVVMAAAVWWTVDLWLGVPRGFVSVGDVIAVVTVGLLAWLGSPYWRLLLRPARAGDVVVTLDRTGITLTDAGFRISAPWSSVSGATMSPLEDGRERLSLVVPGPVRRSGGLLPWLVVRGLRRGSLPITVEPTDTTPDEVRAAIATLSGGSVTVS